MMVFTLINCNDSKEESFDDEINDQNRPDSNFNIITNNPPNPPYINTNILKKFVNEEFDLTAFGLQPNFFNRFLPVFNDFNLLLYVKLNACFISYSVLVLREVIIAFLLCFQTGRNWPCSL